MTTDRVPPMAGEDAEPERVDQRSPVPLTDQLAGILRRAIEAGTLTDTLPSERELTELHEVSRVTVRRALDRLEKEGLIYRAHGRGWFIARR